MATEAATPQGRVEHPSKDVIELSRHVEQCADEKTTNGLQQYATQTKTPQELKEERRFVWKIDLILLPLLSTMFFLASLDRGDVGNASVLGMSKELKLSPTQLSTSISIFYVGYIVFQLPGYLLLKVIPPPAQLGAALMFWGIFNTFLCLAKNYATVYGLRVGVGAGEAILQAGPLYLSFWYRRDELATRGAIFFATSAIAGAFNGIIAYAVEKTLQGANGWASWRWLFLIEGVISVAWGFVILAILPPLPEKKQWIFNEKDTQIARRRALEAYNDPEAKVKPREILTIFKDRRFYLFVIIYSCINVVLASFSGFLPVIIKSFGHSVLVTQALTIPVFFAGAVSAVAIAVLSDRLKQRGLALLGCFVFMGIGWLILLASKNRSLSFAGCFFIAIGVYPSVTICQVWLNNNTPGFTRKASWLGVMVMIAQVFSIVGTEVYSDPPHYYRGNGFALGASVVGGIATLLLYFDFRRQNEKKRAEIDTETARRLRPMGLEEIGNRHPDFTFLT